MLTAALILEIYKRKEFGAQHTYPEDIYIYIYICIKKLLF
jgi:hypothetical protein